MTKGDNKEPIWIQTIKITVKKVVFIGLKTTIIHILDKNLYLPFLHFTSPDSFVPTFVTTITVPLKSHTRPTKNKQRPTFKHTNNTAQQPVHQQDQIHPHNKTISLYSSLQLHSISLIPLLYQLRYT